LSRISVTGINIQTFESASQNQRQRRSWININIVYKRLRWSGHVGTVGRVAMVRMVRMVGMRVSLGTVVMVGMVDDGRRVGVARKVAIYIVPYRPDPNRPDPTNVDSDPAAPIQPTPASAYFWPCQSQRQIRYDCTQMEEHGSTTQHFFSFFVQIPFGAKRDRVGTTNSDKQRGREAQDVTPEVSSWAVDTRKSQG
jgi:hypothetical protein